MSKFPLKVGSKTSALQETARRGPADSPPAWPAGGFVSFRYASAEVWSEGGRTRVRARQARLEDGKLSSESFEGELDRDIAGQALRQAQQQILGQTARLLGPLACWLPTGRSRGA